MYSTKLHVSGIPLDTSIADVAVHFPTAVSFLFPSLISNKPKLYRTAIINVGDEKSANKACNSKIEVKGQTLNIRCFNEKRKWFRKSGHQGRNPAKKMKF
ncbi:hypothetical protein NPIL_13181 [Nephila pilipes]|uniref:Uncharacterized protein n=1 Tax=Nephila pilipes TaxID=299642 RepID=A0A8X6N7T0_NEPPI|nr:hypothetical protein NPIL_13181 [Nephila pilipes]